MNQFIALLSKELKEALRDKRALLMALMIVFMAPVMIFSLSKLLIKEISQTPDIYINIEGGEFAPALITELNRHHILTLSQAPTQESAKWQERNIRLTIPKTYRQDLQAGKVIDIYLRGDYSDKAQQSPLRRIKQVLRNYALGIGYKRLLVRGIDIHLLQPMKLIEQDMADSNNNAIMVTMSLGLYLLMAAFMSGLPVAIDSSAGERERNVLEILLCQPVNTIKIVLAKLTCASAVSCVGVILTLLFTTIALEFVDLTLIGAIFHLDAMTVIALLLLLLPMCILASALQLFVAFQAKNFKEAQSMVSMVIMLPVMVPVIITFIDDRPAWLDWLPISGQSLLMENLFKGVAIEWGQLLLLSGLTLMVTTLLVFAIARKLTSEKVVLALS